MRMLTKKHLARKGQSLVEILVALGIGVILIGGVTALITVNLRSSSESKTTQVASSITQEVIDGVKSKAEGDWNGFYALAKGPSNKYYISSSTLAITPGTEQLTIGEYTFTRYFYVENVNRTQCGIGTPTTAAVTADCATNFPLGSGSIAEDPSTQKVSVMIEWTGGKSVVQTQYVSRTKNAAIRQTDWSGGGGDNSVLTGPNNKFSTASGVDATSTPGSLSAILAGGGNLSTTANISAAASEHWAWNDMIGWIDFGYAAGNVGVNDAKLFGYASSSVGLIAFDCSTTPNGDICGGTPWRVMNSSGTLSGWAYSDAVGWISFSCDHTSDGTQAPYNTNTCGTASYGVSILADGSFTGYAWNESIGWISFNCANQGTCASQGGYDYKVRTNWVAAPITGSLTSPIFDMGQPVALNAIIWKGTTNGGAVRFQVAASNIPNPATWNYEGPDGTAATTYAATVNISTQVSPRDFSNVRYVRYKIFIDSNGGHTASPDVQDIILNYSM